MNLTLIGQMITFAVLVFFVYRVLWGPITRVLEERTQRIADGLAAAEKGKRDLELAHQQVQEMMQQAEGDAAEVIALAERRAAEIAEEARRQARGESGRLIKAARADIEWEANRTREQLREALAELVVAGVAKVLEKEVDARTHAQLIESVVRQL